jgi:NAD(P)-dependent dehydrogenase (short-subunit alcohol dehydrogenase family)
MNIPSFNLDGKTVVVTGGAGLLGSAFSEGLARHGAYVYVADVSVESGRSVCNTLTKNGYSARFIRLDIAKHKSIDRCIQNILKERKSIDVWINNAYPRTKDWNLLFEKIPVASWCKNIDAHLNGYCLCCQKVAEQMKKQKKGSIINLGSIYGIVGPDFSIYEGTKLTMPAAYSVIKGGIVNFTKYLASYYGKNNVRVNCISPGGIYNRQSASFIKRYSVKTALKRMAKPQDIVGAAIFLASDASQYVTGHNLVVDGGWSII